VASRRFIQVLKPVQVRAGAIRSANCGLCGGFRVEVEIDFANPVIGRRTICSISARKFRARFAAPGPSDA